MLATKVACPYCRAVLKSNKPVPEGTPLTCPQCRQAFRAGDEGVRTGAPPFMGAPHAVTAAPPASAISAPHDPTIALPESPSQAKRLFLVLGSLVLIAVMGGVLLWLLTRGGGGDG